MSAAMLLWKKEKKRCKKCSFIWTTGFVVNITWMRVKWSSVVFYWTLIIKFSFFMFQKNSMYSHVSKTRCRRSEALPAVASRTDHVAIVEGALLLSLGEFGRRETPERSSGHGGPVGAMLWHTMICQPELMDVIPSHQSKYTIYIYTLFTEGCDTSS